MNHEIIYSYSNYKIASFVGNEQEIHFLNKVLHLPARARILDLYCGYGRHAIELAKLGYCVTGIDGNSAFLDIAAYKAGEEKVENIFFRHLDMRNLDYCNQFNAVINMFAAFGYFTDEENTSILRKIAQALIPDGLFLIDLLNREWMTRNNLNRYWRHPSGEYVLSYKVEIDRGIVMMRRVLINQLTGHKLKDEFVLRAYSLDEITTILTESGFIVLATYGGFDFSPYTPESSRMIILAKNSQPTNL